MPRQNRSRQRRSRLKAGGMFFKAILALIVIACLIFACRYACEFFIGSEYFNVSRIELIMNPYLKEALSLDFYGIPRRVNIFQLDIDAARLKALRQHPEFNSVIISRKLPNTVSVRIEYKQPVVFVKSGSRFVPLSIDGITLPSEVAKGKVLPVLSGINFAPRLAKTGSQCADKRFLLGVKFISIAGRLWDIKGHRIGVVDLKDTKNISMFLENGIEVKMGDGNSIKQKLEFLKKVAEEPSFDLAKIKYIDLRFSDIVIGAKEAQKKKLTARR